MLISILIDVQYSQKAAFSFEKGSNCQNHSSSGSLHPVKNSTPPSVKFVIPLRHWGRGFTWPQLLLLFEKPWSLEYNQDQMPFTNQSLLRPFLPF